MAEAIPFLDQIKQDCLKHFQCEKFGTFDCLAFGLVDFASQTHQCFEIIDGKTFSRAPSLWFDLSSLTKPLSLGAIYLKFPKIFDREMLWLLEHRAGLTPWGLLPRNGHREQLLSYSIKESPARYSDFSALRLMFEIEKKLGQGLKEAASYFWDRELKYWRDFSGGEICPATGWRRGWIRGEVYDPNAFNIQCNTPHAGLFSTIEGLCRSLLGLNRETSFVERIKQEIQLREQNRTQQRFVWGWDRAEGKKTLAGPGCSPYTFGHLGFTGTMMWIDSQKKRGYVLLTNATKHYGYEKAELNRLRRGVGMRVWNH